jgi:hypothetical protein
MGSLRISKEHKLISSSTFFDLVQYVLRYGAPNMAFFKKIRVLEGLGLRNRGFVNYYKIYCLFALRPIKTQVFGS